MKIDIRINPESLAEMCNNKKCPRKLCRAILPYASDMSNKEKSIMDTIIHGCIGFCNPFKHGECQNKTAEDWLIALKNGEENER